MTEGHDMGSDGAAGAASGSRPGRRRLTLSPRLLLAVVVGASIVVLVLAVAFIGFMRR